MEAKLAHMEVELEAVKGEYQAIREKLYRTKQQMADGIAAFISETEALICPMRKSHAPYDITSVQRHIQERGYITVGLTCPSRVSTTGPGCDTVPDPGKSVPQSQSIYSHLLTYT
jgi:hypothetical protein